MCENWWSTFELWTIVYWLNYMKLKAEHYLLTEHFPFFSLQARLGSFQKYQLYLQSYDLINVESLKLLKRKKEEKESIMFVKLSSVVCNIIVIAILILKLTSAAHADVYKNARLGTRIVQTRYGRLQGLVLPLDNFKFLKPVEVFLSVPYATPPVKSNR